MTRQEKKAFVFRPSMETLRAFRNTTPEQRLEWLEQAGRFVTDFVPPRKLEKWNKLTRKNG